MLTNSLLGAQFIFSLARYKSRKVENFESKRKKREVRNKEGERERERQLFKDKQRTEKGDMLQYNRCVIEI